MQVESTRCLSCFRPKSLCYCAAIPSVANRTDVLILQHRRERFHPFNTARIVSQSLDRCRLMVAHNRDLAEQFDAMQLSPNVGLLYPGEDADLLTELTPTQQPNQLVILDGTWHQAKTLFRDIPRLQKLRRYRLAPETPGRYRIRREPDEHSLSTLEATVAALTAIEPETVGLSRLTDAFDRMIGDQLENKSSNWRQNEKRRRGSPNVPRVLAGDLSNVVVAIGEQERGDGGDVEAQQKRKVQPIYWTAMRPLTGETFRCVIESDSLGDADFMKHMRLDPCVIDQAVSVSEFCNRWKAFLRPGDHVALPHQSSVRLLQNINADFAPAVILKSINVKRSESDSSEIQSAADALPTESDSSRAAERLASAVALVKYLHQRYGHDKSVGLGR